MNKTLLCLFAFLLLWPPLYCQYQNAPSNIEEAGEWFTYYYLHKDSSKVASVIRTMFQEETANKDSLAAPLLGFLSQVFHQNPDKIEYWLREWYDFSTKDKKVIWTALNLSQTPEAEEILANIKNYSSPQEKEFIGKLLKTYDKDLLTTNIESSAVLDMLWGAFSATGEERYIQRIISALSFLAEKQDINRRLIGEAAKWSLTSNALQHEIVLEVCKKEYQKKTGITKKALESIIHSAELLPVK